jgi:hypothetical protein
MRTTIRQLTRWFSMALAAMALTFLTGCASMRLIDSDVVSVAAVPPGMSLQGAKYRFERLPSQVHNPEAGLAEQQAQAAMTAVGLVRDDATASLSVMLGFSGSQYLADPWGRPLGPGWTPSAALPSDQALVGAWARTSVWAWACAFRRRHITAAKSASSCAT